MNAKHESKVDMEPTNNESIAPAPAPFWTKRAMTIGLSMAIGGSLFITACFPLIYIGVFTAIGVPAGDLGLASAPGIGAIIGSGVIGSLFGAGAEMLIKKICCAAEPELFEPADSVNTNASLNPFTHASTASLTNPEEMIINQFAALFPMNQTPPSSQREADERKNPSIELVQRFSIAVIRPISEDEESENSSSENSRHSDTFPVIGFHGPHASVSIPSLVSEEQSISPPSSVKKPAPTSEEKTSIKKDEERSSAPPVVQPSIRTRHF